MMYILHALVYRVRVCLCGGFQFCWLEVNMLTRSVRPAFAEYKYHAVVVLTACCGILAQLCVCLFRRGLGVAPTPSHMQISMQSGPLAIHPCVGADANEERRRQEALFRIDNDRNTPPPPSFLPSLPFWAVFSIKRYFLVVRDIRLYILYSI